MSQPSPANWDRLGGTLLSARFIADRNGADAIQPEHLLLAIFEEPILPDLPSNSVAKTLELSSESIEKLKLEFQPAALKEIQHGDLPLSESSRSLLAEAVRLTESDQHEPDELYLLLALLSSDSPLRDKLLGIGITPENIERALKNHN